MTALQNGNNKQLAWTQIGNRLPDLQITQSGNQIIAITQSKGCRAGPFSQRSRRLFPPLWPRRRPSHNRVPRKGPPRPAAPVLSAEQRITVEQQRRDAGKGLNTPDMTRRVPARGTDAEHRSSQELASLVMSPTDGDPAVPPRTLESPALDTGLSDLLQALVVQLGEQPRP